MKQRAERNDRNIDELIRIANENSDVINAVSVGNENTPDWGENNVPVERLISFAKKLRKETGKQVTFNEGVYEWEHLKDLQMNWTLLAFIHIHCGMEIQWKKLWK